MKLLGKDRQNCYLQQRSVFLTEICLARCKAEEDVRPIRISHRKCRQHVGMSTFQSRMLSRLLKALWDRSFVKCLSVMDGKHSYHVKEYGKFLTSISFFMSLKDGPLFCRPDLTPIASLSNFVPPLPILADLPVSENFLEHDRNQWQFVLNVKALHSAAQDATPALCSLYIESQS